MSRRANYAHRCDRCMMHISLCVCALIPRIETMTRLVLIIHRAELRKPTNTGHLATHCLVNSEVHIRGHEGEPSAAIGWPAASQPVLLFPHETESAPLDELLQKLDPTRSTPVTLIVPDGNWRQASKVRARVPGLRDVPCAHLPKGAPSIYRLRSEAHDTGLATIEAIARSLEITEGPQHEGADVRARLEFVFRAMVERTLWVRGALPTDQVTGGIPKGVVKHLPNPKGISPRKPLPGSHRPISK